jgi:hypothetical protein
VSIDITDQPDKIAFRNGLGHDVAWGDLTYGEESTKEQREEFLAAYEFVKNGSDDWFHTDGEIYQGSTLMRVIRRKADGKLFGFSYWEGGGKYGETFIESNGNEHGFPSKYEWDDDDNVDEDENWYVFRPVTFAPIPAYRFETSGK